jgi:putative ABC transport system permease protein
MVDSFRAAFVDLLDARLVDDVVVELAPRSTRADSAALAALVAPFVVNQLWRGSIDVSSAGVPGRVEYASDDEELRRRFAPNSAPLAPHETLLSEGFARLNGIAAGDKIELAGARGSRKMRVAALFRDYGATQPRLLMSRAAAAHLGDVSFVQELGLSSTVTAELQVLLNQRGIAYTDNAVVRANSIKIFEQTFGITRALTLLALLVAMLALANALAAHNLQMQPTDRLLEALGLDVAGARRLRIWRASLAGGLAIILALPLGLLMAWLLTNLVNPRAFGWQFPLRLTAAGIGWPIAGGLLAIVFSTVRAR